MTAPKEAGEAGAGDGTTQEGRVGEGDRLLAPALLERDSPLAGERSQAHRKRGISSEGPTTPDEPVVEDPCTGGTPPEADAPADTKGTGTGLRKLDPSPAPAPGTAPANKGSLHTPPLESWAVVNPTRRLAKARNAGSGAEGAAE